MRSFPLCSSAPSAPSATLPLSGLECDDLDPPPPRIRMGPTSIVALLGPGRFMKTSQWIGVLVVVVVMVFGITFALNFLSAEKPPATVPTTDGPGPGTGHNLTVPLPVERLYQEEFKPGQHDFWFENPWDEDIHIGLFHVSCSQCVSMQLLAATPEWKARLESLRKQASPQPGGWFFPAGQAPGTVPEAADPELLALHAKIKPTTTLEPANKDAEAVVPAHSVGWLRLRWGNEQTDVKRFVSLDRFDAELWVGSPRTGMNLKVQAEVHFVPALRAEHTDINVADLNETELTEANLDKKPVASFLVWSTTRPALHLKTEVIRLPRYGADRFDPFVAGEPVPLSPKECAALQKDTEFQTKMDAGPVRCAYRIPVKLYGRSKDGKVAVDLGGFRRRVKVWSDEDADVQSMELSLTGFVQGNVQVGARQDNGQVALGVFDSAAGSGPATILVTGKVPGVQLEMDTERTAEYLRDGTRLEKIADVAGLPRWKLHIQVKPNAAHGDFPRAADPLYMDSAVYLKVKGEVVQNVRVSVNGTANANE